MNKVHTLHIVSQKDLPDIATTYDRGLKLAARGQHAAREGIICGPRHII